MGATAMRFADERGEPPSGRAVLIYDDDCGFCRWSAERFLAWDRGGRVRPVALGSAEAGRLLAGMDPERRTASWHLVAPDGSIRSGGAGVAPLLRELPGGAPLAALARRFPTVTDLAYRAVARNRAALGRLLGRRRCAARPRDASAMHDRAR